MNLVEFLQDLSLKGVNLWIEDGRLRSGGSQEVLTRDVIAQLKQYKVEILQLLGDRLDILEGTEGEILWNYWQEKLAGELPVLNLPTERSRSPIQTYNGASHHFKLSDKLTKQLKELAGSSGATLYMLLLAAFQVLLYRLNSLVRDRVSSLSTLLKLGCA